ncbi:hypothetical protein SELMODRAFT_404689 [Selaginella moellendorffii]|uniref:Uncharacterized protein n=1 Tax=Selaginella moellendorffii TaxID=88036 RepID=D8QW36_SELML|nr:hypothetical protein SELMODRAFT_404689 [Selaginella moellendorffii]
MSFKTLSLYSAQQYIQVPDAPERKHQEVLPRKDQVMRHDNREVRNVGGWRGWTNNFKHKHREVVYRVRVSEALLLSSLSTPGQANSEVVGFASSAKALLTCPPFQADELSFKFQNPLVICSEVFPTNDKMDHSRVGLKNETLDRIMDKVLRGPTETKACLMDASSENQDRIHMGSLFPGFRYVIPRDRDMVAEVKGVTYLVVARDNTGEVIVGDNGKPVLVEISADFQESHEIQYKKGMYCERWRCEFVTKILNPALREWLDKRYMSCNFWQPASVIEAKWIMAPEDIYQAGSSGCNELLKELKSSHPIERLYCYVWAKEEYNYGILDIFGSVKVLNHSITPASFERYQRVVEEMKSRLGSSFPFESFNKVPKTLAEMQALYDIRKNEYEEQYNANLPLCLTLRDMLVGVFYRKPNMSRKMVTGKLSTNLTDASGGEYLPAEADRNPEGAAGGLEFQLRTTTDLWDLQENAERYIITLNIPNFAGRVTFLSGLVDGVLSPTGFDVLRIFSNASPIKECSVDIVFPFSSIEVEGLS